MYKWSELTPVGKGIRIMSLLGGFAAGTAFGSTVSSTMIERGQSVLLSNMCGLTITGVYTKFFEVMGDCIIEANEEIK